MQDEHCSLLIDYFGGRKVNLPSHLKAKLNRFSYSDDLLWHQMSPCDPLKIYVSHNKELKQKILNKLHDAPSGPLEDILTSVRCILAATPISVGSELYSIMRRLSARKACTF